MTITATSVFNRAGTGHIWFGHPNGKQGYWQSWCGLSERGTNLDVFGMVAPCKKCAKRAKAHGR